MNKRLVVPVLATCLLACWNVAALAGGETIPLPEHPRPDFQRAAWINLNGDWGFRFDQQDAGLQEKWFAGAASFPDTILVPFPWGSPLSRVTDKATIAWYARTVRAPEAWRAQRVFLVIGACDWETQAWLDGQPIGSHRGGYAPFEFDLTPFLKLMVNVMALSSNFQDSARTGFNVPVSSYCANGSSAGRLPIIPLPLFNSGGQPSATGSTVMPILKVPPSGVYSPQPKDTVESRIHNANIITITLNKNRLFFIKKLP